MYSFLWQALKRNGRLMASYTHATPKYTAWFFYCHSGSSAYSKHFGKRNVARMAARYT